MYFDRSTLDDGDDRMNENDEDIVHAGIVPKSQKIPELRPILYFATHSFGEVTRNGEYRSVDPSMIYRSYLEV